MSVGIGTRSRGTSTTGDAPAQGRNCLIYKENRPTTELEFRLLRGEREDAMQALVEVGAAVAGIMMGLGVARLALAGILTLTFGRRL